MSSISVSLRRVVVTGMGIVTPLGVGTIKTWEEIKRGNVATRKLSEAMEGCGDEQAWKRMPSQVAAVVPREEFQEAQKRAGIKETDDRIMSKAMKFGIVAAEEAIKDAGWSPKELSEKQVDRTGVAVGMSMVDLDYIAQCHKLVSEGEAKKIGPYFVPRILPNLAPGHISIRNNFRGPNHSVSTACATGSHAIGDAFRMIQMNSADVMLCGGTEACISPLAMMGFCRARALSTKFNSDPQKASRPFDRDRDGFVIGEGAGILVIEELHHALDRGARIYGEILGYGLSGDAHHITAGREDGRCAVIAMRDAMRDEDYRDLWYINAHATSTPRGDIAELEAIVQILKGRETRPFVSSNKGNLGHLLGAAGAVESALALQSLKSGTIPKCANLVNFDEKTKSALDSVNLLQENVEDKRNTDSRRLILKNSFGFGGTNVSLLFGEYKG